MEDRWECHKAQDCKKFDKCKGKECSCLGQQIANEFYSQTFLIIQATCVNLTATLMKTVSLTKTFSAINIWEKLASVYYSFFYSFYNTSMLLIYQGGHNQ